MFITVLPKPDESYVCAAKIKDITPYGNVLISFLTLSMFLNICMRRGLISNKNDG